MRGPKHVVKTGKTPVLDGKEWRTLMDSIPTETFRDLRDRALIATLSYSFARITAALKMRVEDFSPRAQAGGSASRERRQASRDAVPPFACRNTAGLHRGRRHRRGSQRLAISHQPWTQRRGAYRGTHVPIGAWRMIRRRAVAGGIHAPIGNHTFRATGITAYLSNGGALEHAQSMAAHESPRTTKLYDRTKDRLTQDEVERIRL